ncbi:DUF2125 domain-containing protein [Lichenicoccus sp.]|uniref:DUF2125 domain-containing protein n=1 Tax=Lichenicoccus sp. TaxID=2781899 RepID=UPI003D0FE864
MRPRLSRLRAPLALALLLLGADTLGWLYAQHVLDRRLMRLQAQASEAGWRFDALSMARGGWPLAATRRFEEPGLYPGGRLGGLSGGAVWSASRLTAAISVLHPSEMTLRLGGGQVIATTTIATTGSHPAPDLRQALRFRGDDVTLAIPLGTRPRQLRLHATRLRVAFPAGLGLAPLRVRRLEGSLRWTGAAAALSIASQDLDLAAGAAGPGLAVDTGALELSLVGPLAAKGAGWADRLRAWRDKDGRLIVTRAALLWPDARLALAGNAALDGNLRPDGAFSLRIVGADALVERSVRAGLLSAAQATSIRAILGLVAAATDTRQGSGSITLPLDLHAGTLALGRIPLLLVPALAPGLAATAPAAPMP